MYIEIANFREKVIINHAIWLWFFHVFPQTLSDKATSGGRKITVACSNFHLGYHGLGEVIHPLAKESPNRNRLSTGAGPLPPREVQMGGSRGFRGGSNHPQLSFWWWISQAYGKKKVEIMMIMRYFTTCQIYEIRWMVDRPTGHPDLRL